MSYKPDKRHKMLRKVMRVLPTDYTDYGGTVDRNADDSLAYQDCSCGCKWAFDLDGTLGMDWLVCGRPDGPRAGLLTFEHQAGFGCFEGKGRRTKAKGKADG